MFRFCQLDHEQDPETQKSFTPQEEIKDWKLKGETAGLELSRTIYSKALKNTIFECLYENPQLRPGLLELKDRVHEGLKAAKAEQPGAEPWDDFLAPEPESDASSDDTATEPGDSKGQKGLQKMQEARAAERQAREAAADDDELPRKKPPGQTNQPPPPPPTGGSIFGGSMFGGSLFG